MTEIIADQPFSEYFVQNRFVVALESLQKNLLLTHLIGKLMKVFVHFGAYQDIKS